MQKADLLLSVFIAGDVGGYMGLLVGAGVLSIVEFLDVFINYIASKFWKDPKSYKQPEHNGTALGDVQTTKF